MRPHRSLASALHCTGRLRILPRRAAALASAAALAAAPRLTSARECWPRVAGVARRAAFATAARLPPLECGLGFLALVPFRGFMNEALFQSFIHRPAHRIDLEFHRPCLVDRFHLRPAAAFAARLLLSRRHALALRAAVRVPARAVGYGAGGGTQPAGRQTPDRRSRHRARARRWPTCCRRCAPGSGSLSPPEPRTCRSSSFSATCPFWSRCWDRCAFAT